MDDKVFLECPKCGFQNDLFAVHCTNCRINLDWALENSPLIFEENSNQPDLLLRTSTYPLAKQFKFTYQDLLANRAGRMSSAQIKRTSQKALLLLIPGILFLFVGIFVIGFRKLNIGWVALSYATIISIGLLYISWFFSQVAQAGVVEEAVGTISIRRSFMGVSRACHLCIQDKEFFVNPYIKFEDLVIPDTFYRVYYSPRRKTIILSIEVVEAEVAVGTISIRRFLVGNNQACHLCIQDKAFRVNPEIKVEDLFIPDAYYRVYFSPQNNTILSIEQVQTDLEDRDLNL